MALIDTECVLPRPDLAELHTELTAEFSKRLLGGAPVLPMSTEDVLSFVMAGAVNLMFGAVSQAMRESEPATMCCENLVIYGATHGLDIFAATRSKGYVAISGSPGAAIPHTLRFVAASSREYKPDLGVTSNPTALDSTGHAVLRVVAALAGSAFNLPAGYELTVSTTTPGINMAATALGNGLTGGADDEDCEAYRARVVAAERADIIVTNEQWYLREAAKYPGVTRVCTDECAGCCDPARIDMYPFIEGVYGDAGTAPYGVPPCGVLDDMTEWAFGKDVGKGQGWAPLGRRGEFLPALPTVLNITARCFTGCPSGAEARVRAAIVDYVRANFCVGSTVCKDQIRAALYRALGGDSCIADVQLHFDSSLRFQDDANAYLDCGHLLVIGSVALL